MNANADRTQLLSAEICRCPVLIGTDAERPIKHVLVDSRIMSLEQNRQRAIVAKRMIDLQDSRTAIRLS